METWKVVIEHIFDLFDLLFWTWTKANEPVLGVNYNAGQEEDAGVYALRTTFLWPISLYRPRISSSCVPQMAATQGESNFVAYEKDAKRVHTAEPRRSVNPCSCSAIKWGRIPDASPRICICISQVRWHPQVSGRWARAVWVYSAIHHGCRQLPPRLHRQGSGCYYPPQFPFVWKLMHARVPCPTLLLLLCVNRVHYRIYCVCRMQAAKMCTWAPTRARFSSSSTLHQSGMVHDNHIIVPSVSIYNIGAIEM